MKGQNLRIFVGGKCIASAKSCTFHIAGQTEDSSTKDSTGNWAESEFVGLSWDVKTDALVVLTDPVTGGDAKSSVDLLGLMIAGTAVAVVFDTTSGNNNRTGQNSTIKKSGNAYITDYSINATNKQIATASISLTGTGALS